MTREKLLSVKCGEERYKLTLYQTLEEQSQTISTIVFSRETRNNNVSEELGSYNFSNPKEVEELRRKLPSLQRCLYEKTLTREDFRRQVNLVLKSTCP